MTEKGHAVRSAVQWGEVLLGHLAAIAVGLAMVVVGLGMGVTMVMLPMGIVIGLAGVLLLIWGVFGHLEQRRNDGSS